MVEADPIGFDDPHVESGRPALFGGDKQLHEGPMLTGCYSRTGGEIHNTLQSQAGPEEQILGSGNNRVEEDQRFPVVPRLAIQQDAPILPSSNDELEFE